MNEPQFDYVIVRRPKTNPPLDSINARDTAEVMRGLPAPAHTGDTRSKPALRSDAARVRYRIDPLRSSGTSSKLLLSTTRPFTVLRE